MHIIVARIKVKPDCLAEFLVASRAIIEGTRAEPGCIFYALHQDVHEPESFLFYEEWQDRSAIDLHFAEAHFLAFGQQIADLIEEPPQVTIHTVAQSVVPTG
jgi:quinol monooxygenase YgiN